VDFTVGGGDATLGRDYVATAGRLTFAPGETTHTVLVPLLDDDEADPRPSGSPSPTL
jgi:endoglucanase